MTQAYRTASEVLNLIASKSESVQPINEERRRLYCHAASVLVSLKEPELLQPVGGGGVPGEGEHALEELLIPATGRGFEGTVMLHPEARRQAISELGSVEARRQALDANPSERTGSLQQLLERYLLQDEVSLDEQPPEQLDETFQIVSWLEGTLPNLPPLEAVRRRLAFRSFIRPFESLAGDDLFRGRKKELDQLRAYIGVVPPNSRLTRLKLWASDWVRPAAMPALSISGPGGVGKSALVARFMLEHSRVAPEARLLFAYLDFDRSTLSITEPETLLVEILNQLDLQFQNEGYFRTLHDSFAQEMAAERVRTGPDTSHYTRVTVVITQLMKLIEDSLGPRPFVIVLDTFEEVQYRGEKLAYPLWEILARMQELFPFLRIVISGRAPVKSLILSGKPPEEMVLGDLDNEAAVAYLKGLGIQDAELAQMLVKQLGGVPLSLKLAAAVVKRDGVERVSDVSRKPTLFSSTSDSTIQGLLFSRILGHLHDPVLERVAHPGLVLRRLSPAVILNVLNEPCELGLSHLAEAQVLFDKLSRETALVASDTLDGTLVHRPELRRTMLKLLLEKEPDRAAQINRKAVEWYSSQQESWRAKAEELYHRLQLRQTPMDRWFEDPDVRSSLQSSISELPAVSQRHLATLGYQIDPEVLSQASREDQETALAAEVEALLPYGPRSVESARLLLTDFKADHASPLFAASARVAAQQNRFTDAAELLKTGLEQAFLDFNSSQALTLLSEQAWLLRVEILAGGSSRTLPLLGEHARQYNLLPFILQHRIQSYELLEKQNADASVKAQSLREISTLLKQLNSQDLWSLFPLLSIVAPLLDAETRNNVMNLIGDSESPFARVHFPTRTPQFLLDDLLRISSMLDVDAFPQIVAEICDNWPFQILRVKPPYSSRAYGHETYAF